MKNQPLNKLQEELQSVGADNAEIDKLLPIATRLRQLKTSDTATSKITHSGRWKLALSTSIVASGLAIFVAVIIASQSVLPNSRMYSIQKISDTVAIDIHPEYRATVMMRRAQQLKILVTNRASSKVVLATLADYSREASAYKSTSGNYAVFEDCKASLQQAAKQALTPERQAINQALTSLENV
jgi:hypothetical protein